MSNAELGLKLCFDNLGQKIEELKNLRDTREQDAIARAEPAADSEADTSADTSADTHAEAETHPDVDTGAVDPFFQCVDELHRFWKIFAEPMRDRIDLEDLLQRASLSYDEETKIYKEEFKQKAVDAMNGEIDRLRNHINNLLQIHKYNL